MSTVHTTKLFRVKGYPVVFPDLGPAIILEPGTILWMHSSRKSTVGGYIGWFSFTYIQVNGFSPKHGKTWKMDTEHVEPVY